MILKSLVLATASLCCFPSAAPSPVAVTASVSVAASPQPLPAIAFLTFDSVLVACWADSVGVVILPAEALLGDEIASVAGPLTMTYEYVDTKGGKAVVTVPCGMYSDEASCAKALAKAVAAFQVHFPPKPVETK